MKGVLILAALAGLASGCGDSSGWVELPKGKADSVIYVKSDMVISKSYKGTTFVISDGATLYAGKHTIDARNNANSSFPAVIINGHGGINGGVIKYAVGGVVVNPTIDSPYINWKIILSGLLKVDREEYIDSVRGSVEGGCSNINGTKFVSNNIGIYISMFVSCLSITNISINYGKLGIYHDAYSMNTRVSDSQFNSIGRKNLSSSGFIISKRSSRESVAIDGSSFNVYENNRFRNGAKNAINLYVNCGEISTEGIPVPREEAAVNNAIRNNLFNGFGTAIHVSSRGTNRVTYPCRTDESGDRVVGTDITDNTFINVGTNIRYK